MLIEFNVVCTLCLLELKGPSWLGSQRESIVSINLNKIVTDYSCKYRSVKQTDKVNSEHIWLLKTFYHLPVCVKMVFHWKTSLLWKSEANYTWTIIDLPIPYQWRSPHCSRNSDCKRVAMKGSESVLWLGKKKKTESLWAYMGIM